MAFPVTPPVLSQSESVDAIAEAEAGIAQCMADFLCNTVLPNITALTDVDDQVALAKSILCAYTCKEKGMAALVDALANKILADKGLIPGGGGPGDGCVCDC